MRGLAVLGGVGLLAASAWAGPVWEADKTYNADSGLAPSASGGTFTPWIDAASGTNTATITTKGGQSAWYGLEGKRRKVANTTVAPMNFNKELWIEWNVWVDSSKDVHQGPSLAIVFDGVSMNFMSDGNFSGPGSWNAQNATILDGTGTSTNGVDFYTERMLATKNAWHTIAAHVIPKTMSGSGSVEVEFSINGGVDNTPGSDVVGDDGDYARYLMTGGGLWDKDSAWGLSAANGLISFGSPIVAATNRSYIMGTHEVKWTQLPEPAGLILLGLSSIFLVRRRRA